MPALQDSERSSCGRTWRFLRCAPSVHDALKKSGRNLAVRLATSSRPGEGVTRDFGPVILQSDTLSN